MILVTKTSDQARQMGHTLSTCTILTCMYVCMYVCIFIKLHTICVLFRCVLHPLPLPLSSCLGCIPPLIGLPSLRFYAVASSLFSTVCVFFVYVFYFIATMSFAGYFCPSFSVCFPCSSPIPGLTWCGSVYLVTTAGFVADQLM